MRIKIVTLDPPWTNDHSDGSPQKLKRGRPKKFTDQKGNQSTLLQSPSKIKKIKPSIQSPNIILSSLIENNVVSEGEEVHYRLLKIRPKLTEGRITRYGIECKCCQKIFALSEFEVHAGSTRHRPSANIILSDGRTLTDCQAELAGGGARVEITRNPERELSTTTNPKRKLSTTTILKKRKSPERKLSTSTIPERRKSPRNVNHGKKKNASDYICSFCYDGGDLVICDQCPSTFHKKCIGLDSIPCGKWCCPFCCCNICGQRKLKDTDVLEDGFILSCDQCPHKFHVACARNKGLTKLERKDTTDTWFCSDKCEFVFSGLQQLLGRPIAVGSDNLTWTLLKPLDSDNFDPKVSSANNRKLNLALKVMHECFVPVKEAYTGKDLVEDIIFSRESDLHRLNFQRFYTVLVEKKNELVSVANLRVSGDKMAEVPLVATKFQYQRLGMCRILIEELERQLMNLCVEKLVLPSAFSRLETWTKGFGFSVMTDSDKQEYKDHPILLFEGTTLCQKFLERFPTAKSKAT